MPSTLNVNWSDAQGGPHTTILSVSGDVNADPSLPVIILLHGAAGNLNHWVSPDISPSFNYNLDDPLPPFVDEGWQFTVPLWPFGVALDPTKTVVGWQTTLNNLKFLSINYVQIDPTGPLSRAVLELTSIVQTVSIQFARPIVFLCHSRGGLLLRLFLQHNRANVGLLRAIAGAVTLHTPHQGTQVADLATAIHDAIIVSRALFPLLLLWQLALGLLDAFVVGQADIPELSPTSQVIMGLRAAETVPLPVSIPIHTFGGTQPTIVRARVWAVDPISWVPQWHWPPYHWQSVQSSVPLVDGTPIRDVAPEERTGGDVLVTDAASHLPGEASHHSNPVNHAAALWDDRIKAQVVPILRSFAIPIQASKIRRGDFDGDGKTDMAVWRPSSGVWWLINSSNGQTSTQQWGVAGDIPVPGDFDGDGKTDMAVWRPSSGVWWIINSSNGQNRTQQWGIAGDIPVSGDYDGDGKTDMAVWRPSTGEWWITNSSNGITRTQQWGLAGDIPVPGDFDGDGKTDMAVWRPSTGEWWIINSSNGQTKVQQWGLAGDIPVSGDYDGDGKTDMAVWRPSTGEWWIINSSNGQTRTQQWGAAGDIPA